MANNRYDQRENRWRDAHVHFGDDNEHLSGERARHGERGFFDRAGDEVASWFGDDEAEHRRMQDRRSTQGRQGYGRYERDPERAERDGGRGRRWRGGGPRYAEGHSGGIYGGAGSFDVDRQQFGRRDFSPNVGGDYRPFSGDVGRSDSWQDRYYGGYATAHESRASEWAREHPHYSDWRRRQIESLDRDYDEYRRENQTRFEDEFSAWRNRRQGQRQLLGEIREHMEVCGNDDQVIGKVDRVAGDRIILTKNDDPSGRHHSIPCSMIDRVEGERVILDIASDNAKRQWRDESSQRALFEREDQGRSGPGILNRSFSGTYREE